jgi:hypothetical protein
MPTYLPICLSLCLSICLLVYLSIYLSIYLIKSHRQNIIVKYPIYWLENWRTQIVGLSSPLTERLKDAATSPPHLMSVQSKHSIAGGLNLVSQMNPVCSVWTKAWCSSELGHCLFMVRLRTDCYFISYNAEWWDYASGTEYKIHVSV